MSYSKDDFWDISKLVPKSKPAITPFATKSSVKEIVVETVSDGDQSATEASSSENKINFSAYESARGGEKRKEMYSYVPKDAGLIKKVTIKPSNDRFDFYDTYRKAALIYYDYKCPKSEFVPFYSYKPQYSQMTTEQKRYYFYWRDEVRHSRYLKTDYSYIYLYAYEILNLPEKVGKEEGLRLLLNIWRAYRDEFPGIDFNFSPWVQDYCLIYELPCPFDEIRDFLFDIINKSTFKEFYLSNNENGGNGAAAMIAYLSDYDWRRGKYASGDNADSYRMHIEGAMKGVLGSLLSPEMLSGGEVSTFTRTAFPGSLCTHTVKCILEVEYCSVASSPKLREAVTLALKYTENKLRACLGVKSRLAVKELSDDIKIIIDRYFAAEFARLKREKERKNAPEYERLYDAPESRVSLADAIEIERASWKMTARLVEGTEEADDTDTVLSYEKTAPLSVTEPPIPEVKNGSDQDTYGLSPSEIRFLSYIHKNDLPSAISVAKENGALADSYAEKINEAFSDNFGDVILEDDGCGGFAVIDDYYEEIEEWLTKIMK